MDLDPGTVVANRYRISRLLGRGGMGEVYAAENVRTGRPVAVKLLRSDSKAKTSAVARFRQEARAAGSINSDHVTQVLDIEEDPAHGVVIVFELLEGESLIERLKRTGPMPLEELHPLIEQVWMGLADAHKVGVVHRDLKPSNIFLEQRPDGTTRAKILDFGISKLPKEIGGETLTEMGQSLGTFSFMPPEQIGKAKMVDHRADIYACTTLIYQSLTGQLPYAARNILLLVEMKGKTDPRTLADAMGFTVDPRLEAFVQRGLSRDPGRRFQTALEALAGWREIRPSLAPVRQTPRPLPPSGARSSIRGAASVPQENAQVRIPGPPAVPKIQDRSLPPQMLAPPTPGDDDSIATIAIRVPSTPHETVGRSSASPRTTGPRPPAPDDRPPSDRPASGNSGRPLAPQQHRSTTTPMHAVNQPAPRRVMPTLSDAISRGPQAPPAQARFTPPPPVATPANSPVATPAHITSPRLRSTPILGQSDAQLPRLYEDSVQTTNGKTQLYRPSGEHGKNRVDPPDITVHDGQPSKRVAFTVVLVLVCIVIGFVLAAFTMKYLHLLQ